MKAKKTRDVYCVLGYGTHKLVDDKSLATKFSKKDAENMLSSYGKAMIEEVEFNSFIVVAQTESKGSYTI